uniref:Uncharacterized protein n=1 Tax=Arundo donax TaxID=35708 RepID=A0A0A9AJA8_ARUDO
MPSWRLRASSGNESNESYLVSSNVDKLGTIEHHEERLPTSVGNPSESKQL